MPTTPVIPMPPGDDDDPLGVDRGNADERQRVAETEHDEQKPSVITLDVVEKAAEGNSDT